MSRRAALGVAAGAALALAALAGCAQGPGARQAIQARYDAIGAATGAGDVGRVRALWTADPEAAGSPLAALARAKATGARVSAWSAEVHRFRMVGDTAVVDVGVRAVADSASARRVTSAVVRGFWVRGAGGWTIARTEPLGPTDVESLPR